LNNHGLIYDDRMTLDNEPIWSFAEICHDTCVFTPLMSYHLDCLHHLLSNLVSDGALPIIRDLSSPKIMISHNPVWFTAEILDYRSNEMFFIETSTTSQLIIKGLDVIKGLFGMECLDKTGTLAWLLNWHSHHPTSKGCVFIPSEFNHNRHIICDRLQIDPDRYYMLMWFYYVQCKHHNLIMDVQGFKQHMVRMISIGSNTHQSSGYRWAKAAIEGKSQRCFSRDYLNLFFDLDIPNDSLLYHIHRDRIRDYSRQNLSLLSDLIPVLTDDVAEMLSYELSSLQQRLAATQI